MATGASGSAIKAGEAFVELNADDSKFTSVLKRASSKFTRFGSMVNKLGIGLVGLGSAIVAPLAASTFATLKYIDSIQDVADRTNSTTEAVSRLAYAAKLSATSLEDVEAANKKLTASAVAAENGNQEQADAFEKMGISANDFLSLDIDQRFIEIARSLDEMEEPIEKNRFLIALLGKQALAMTPLLSDGADGLNKMFKEAENLGAVIRSDDGKKAAATMDAFDAVLTSVKTTLIEVGLAIFSLGEDVKEGKRVILLYTGIVRDWIKNNRQLVAIIAIVGGAIAVAGVALIAFGLMLGAIGAAISGVVAGASAIGAVLGLITLKGIILAVIITAVVALIGGLIYAFFKFSELGKTIGASWIAAFRRIGETFSVMWEGILGALKKGDMDLIGRIATVGLHKVWIDVLIALKQSWFGFLNFFIEGFVAGTALIRVYFTRLVSFIKTAGLAAIKFIIDKTLMFIGALEGWVEEVDKLIKSIKDLSTKIEVEIKAEANTQLKVEQAVFKEAEDFNTERKTKQNQSITADIDEGIRLFKELQGLKDIVNQPVVEPVVLPLAPRPHEPGKIDKSLGMLGDSVKGTFNSADFRGTLGLGDANKAAKDSVDLQRRMLTELQGIHGKIGLAEFE